MLSPDTSREAYERQIEVLRSMSPGERLALALRSSEEMLHVVVDGIRTHHPEYDDEQVRWAFRRLRLGDHLFRQVWPDAPLVGP